MWATNERVKVIEDQPGNTKKFDTFEEAAKLADTMIDANRISGNDNILCYKVVEI